MPAKNKGFPLPSSVTSTPQGTVYNRDPRLSLLTRVFRSCFCKDSSLELKIVFAALTTTAGYCFLACKYGCRFSSLENGLNTLSSLILSVLLLYSIKYGYTSGLSTALYALNSFGIALCLISRPHQHGTLDNLSSFGGSLRPVYNRTNNRMLILDTIAFVSVMNPRATTSHLYSGVTPNGAVATDIRPKYPGAIGSTWITASGIIPVGSDVRSLRNSVLYASRKESEPDVNYYNVLSLPMDCSDADIKKRHDELKESLKSLPSVDRCITKKIKEAYKVLSNPASRALYDEKLKRSQSVASSSDEYDSKTEDEYDAEDGVELFTDPDDEYEIEITDHDSPNQNRSGFTGFLGNLLGFNRDSSIKKLSGMSNSDVSTSVDVDLKSLVFGGTVKVSVDKFCHCPDCNSSKSAQQKYISRCAKCRGCGMISKSQRTPFGYISTSRTCMSCSGRGVSRVQDCFTCNNTGRVQQQTEVDLEIPAGTKEGSIFKVKGKGHSGGYSSRPGDLFVKVASAPSEHEFIQGDKVYTTADIDYVSAILGDTVDVATFCGSKKVTVPAGTQNGDEVVVGSYEGKTHLIRFNVLVPRKPSQEEVSLLQKISKLRNSK
ncbi:chaperone [Babesia ovis]|uniref:Chaperone n=1 Tax=Babesia ovis TaxID=5869 RepID=A0A9W5WVB4_BABOV|nr:chaperone [Babesia ovis]